MFSKAHLGRVWTTIDFEIETESGETKTVKARFLIAPLTRKEYQAHRKSKLQRAAVVTTPALPPAIINDETPAPDRTVQDTIDRLLVQLEEAFEADEADALLLLERTHGWVIKDEAGEDVPFDRDYLRDLLEYDTFYRPYAQRFAEVCQGAVRKNSSPGPAGVPA